MVERVLGKNEVESPILSSGSDMRPNNLHTKIFLDGGDPRETAGAIKLLGFLDGQTTNPTLIAKSPAAKQRLDAGKKFSREEAFEFYQEIVGEISRLIPHGSVSVEVYADQTTSASEMFVQGKELFSWIPNAHVKYPTNAAGLEAAERSIKDGMRVNMTLVFSQSQAAAVYAATRGAKKGDVLVSPFVGRLDDRGECGMDLIRNILAMYEKGDGHAEVLTASVRNIDHFLSALALRSDIITAPFAVLKAWSDQGMPVPEGDYEYGANLARIPFADIDLTKNWRGFDISHELTDKGIDRFATDWNTLIKQL